MHTSAQLLRVVELVLLSADVLGAWASDIDEDADSEDSSSSGFTSEADIAEAMQDGLSLAERYPVQSAQDVRGTWTPLTASGLAFWQVSLVISRTGSNLHDLLNVMIFSTAVSSQHGPAVSFRVKQIAAGLFKPFHQIH